MSSACQLSLEGCIASKLGQDPTRNLHKMDDSRIFLDAGRIGILLLGGNSQSGDTSHLSQT
jgi:hypothetical protein